MLYARRRAALRRVRRVASGDEGAARILRAVERTLRGELEPEERAWIRRIVAAPAAAAPLARAHRSPGHGPGDRADRRRALPLQQVAAGGAAPLPPGPRAPAGAVPGAGDQPGGLGGVPGGRARRERGRRAAHHRGLATAGRALPRPPRVAPAPGGGARGAVRRRPPRAPRPDGAARLRVRGRAPRRPRDGRLLRADPAELGPGALVVFDDVAWSPGMAEAWTAIQADPRVRVAVSLGTMGVCIVGGEGERSASTCPSPAEPQARPPDAPGCIIVAGAARVPKLLRIDGPDHDARPVAGAVRGVQRGAAQLPLAVRAAAGAELRHVHHRDEPGRAAVGGPGAHAPHGAGARRPLRARLHARSSWRWAPRRPSWGRCCAMPAAGSRRPAACC